MDTLELAELLLSLPPTDPFFDSLEGIIGAPNVQFIKSNGYGVGAAALATYLGNFTAVGHFGGFLSLPSVQTDDSRIGDKLRAQGTHNFVNASIDLDGITSDVIESRFNVNIPTMDFTLYPICVSGHCVSFGYDTLDVKTVVKLFQTEEYNFDPVPRVKLEFPQPVPFVVQDCDSGDPFNYYDPSNPNRVGALSKNVANASAVNPPPGSVPSTPSGTDIMVPENWLICGGTSNIVVINANDKVEIVYPLDAHTMEVTPTFLLPNLVSNDTSNRFEQSLVGTAAVAAFDISGFEIVAPRTLQEEHCISLPNPPGGEECTPEIRFDGLDFGGISLGLGPLFQETIPLFAFSDTDMFDIDRLPWVMGGFNSPTQAAFTLDAEIQPAARITGPNAQNRLNEGQEGTFSCATSQDDDFGEDIGVNVECRWDFDDGITAVGTVVSHTFADNGAYDVELIVDDGHGLTDDDTLTITVDNVIPTVSAGSNKTVNEGSPAGLGLDLFGKNLVVNGRGEGGTVGWSPLTGGFGTTPYAPTAENTVAETGTIGVQLIENGEAEFGTSDWSASGTFLAQLYGNNDDPPISTLIGPNIIVNPGAEDGLIGDPAVIGWTGDGHVRDYLPCTPTSQCPRDSGRGYADTGDYFHAVNRTTENKTNPWSAITWFDAKLEAEARTHAGFTGHLGTFHSDAEINFVRDAVPFGAYERWIGGFQPDHCCESHAGWAWVTGEAFTYDNWASGEPNGGGSENHIQFWNSPFANSGQWNDRNATFSNAYGYVVQYGASNSHTLPTDHGDRQFFGGYNDPSNSLTQIIDVSGVGELIDAGQINFDFSGWLGGGGRDPDYANVLVRFRNSSGTLLATHQLGPVFRETRGYKTGMIPRATSGSVPAGTRDVEVVIQTTRNSEHHDINNSAQVDELSLTFNAPGVDLANVTVGRFPTTVSDGPPDRLTSFFHAGSQSSTTASQSRDISGAAVLIDEGQVNYDLSGFLGGFDNHDDRATLRARFKNSSGGVTGTASIVSATPGERGGDTELQLRTATGAVPVGTRSVDIDLVFDRFQGVTNDGYADSLSLILSAPGVTLSGVPVGGGPKLNSPQGPANRNLSFFSGSAAVATASQTIDVSEGAELINDNDATFSLEGFLGGFANQSDSGVVIAIFRDGPGGSQLGTAQIGPITAADRSGITGLVFRSAAGAVPVGTRAIEVQAKLQRSDGTLDNLSLVLLAPSGANFQDPGRLDNPFSAQLVWGDGASEPGFVNEAEGVGSVVATHIYDDDGVYDVSVEITDKDGAQGQDGFQVTVLNVPPVVLARDNIFANGVEGTRLVATFDDAGANDGNFTASITWGDGSITAGDVNQGTKQVTGTHTYTFGGSFPRDVVGSVTVTDKDGGSTTRFFTSTVVNVRLQSIEAGNNSGLSIVEGGSVTPSGSFQTVAPGVPVPALIYEYTWDFGDFTSVGPENLGEIVANLNQIGATALAHAYGDDGQSVVTLTVNAFEGTRLATADSDSFTVTITNANPIVEAGGNRSVTEGGTASLNPATFTDAGAADTHTATIDWGDNTSLAAGVVDQAASTVSGDHVYADDGDYTVTVTVRDDDGGIGVDTFEYEVTNSSPVVLLGGGQSATEGDIVSLNPVGFTDAGLTDTHTATIDWGDGPPEPGAVNRVLRLVSGSHVYADDDTYTVEVCVTDDEGDSGCGLRTITVGNALPVVSAAGTRSAEEGELVFINSTFTDAGSGDTHSATIDWGDLTSLDTGVVDPVTKSVTGNHRYADDDDYTITVVVRDDDSGQGSGELDVAVSNVPVEIVSLQLTSVEPIFIEGKPVGLEVVSNDDGTLDTHTATINWGDGINEAGTVSEVPFGPPGSATGVTSTVANSHNYADNGSYTVEVCVTDDEGATTCQTAPIEITNAAPVLEAGANITVSEGVATGLNAEFSDSGFDSDTIPSLEDFTATVDWGDGTAEPVVDIDLVETPGSSGVLTAGTIQASHVYGLYGTYLVTVCVTDDDHDPAAANEVDGQDCDTLSIEVENAPPVVDAGEDRTSIEGIPFALNPFEFSDLGYVSEFTATVDWGDGTTEPAGEINIVVSDPEEGQATTGIVEAVHSFADDGTYTIEVCVSDGLSIECDTFDATILNVAPTVDAGPDHEILAGQFVDENATFSDPGFDNLALNNVLLATAENFTSTIDWGDGSPVEAGSLSETPGSEGVPTTGNVIGSHRYLLPGVYTVTITTCDDDEGCDSDTQVVTARAIVLVIDEDSIDNGAAAIEELAFVQGLGGGDPATLVNDGIAAPGVRLALAIPAGVVTPANPSAVSTGTIIGIGAPGGTAEPLLSGQIGDEGWFALQTIPGTWATAGPTADGLRNYILAGPGLGTGSNPEVLLDKVPDVLPLRSAELSALEGLTVCGVVYDGDISINFDPLQGSLQGANLGLIAFNVLDVGAPLPSVSVLSGVTIQVLPTSRVCDSLLSLPPFEPPTPTPSDAPTTTSLFVMDGYSEKDGKTLEEDGKTYVVQASDNDRADIESGHYVSYQFSNLTIPDGATISSVKIYVEHWEESDFSGTIQWRVGTGWPGSPTVWASIGWPNIDSTLRIGELNEAEDFWNVTDVVNTPARLSDMELLIQNNSTNGKLTKTDLVYVEVDWFTP